MADATLPEVRDYFKLSTTELKQEWTKLTEEDKRQIKSGIGDGTLTY